MEKNNIKILEAESIGNRTIIVAQLIKGEPDIGTILNSSDDKNMFEITGVGFISADQWQENVRGYNICSIKGNYSLKAGDELFW